MSRPGSCTEFNCKERMSSLSLCFPPFLASQGVRYTIHGSTFDSPPRFLVPGTCFELKVYRPAGRKRPTITGHRLRVDHTVILDVPAKVSAIRRSHRKCPGGRPRSPVPQSRPTCFVVGKHSQGKPPKAKHLKTIPTEHTYAPEYVSAECFAPATR